MKTVQKWIFWFGIVMFVVSVGFMGGWIGDSLWRAGIAAMMMVMAMRSVWPMGHAGSQGKGRMA